MCLLYTVHHITLCIVRSLRCLLYTVHHITLGIVRSLRCFYIQYITLPESVLVWSSDALDHRDTQKEIYNRIIPRFIIYHCHQQKSVLTTQPTL
jgi:hypothetical protein